MEASDLSFTGGLASQLAATPPPLSIPQWVHSIQAPVWITSTECRLCHVNDPGCRLLGLHPQAGFDRPCHEIVCGRDGSGRTFCSTDCPVQRATQRGLPLEPFNLQIGSGPASHWVHVLVIQAEWPPHHTCLVHCALPDDRGKRVEEYFSRVMLRTPPAHLHYAQLLEARLSRREWEVLRLLAEDESLHGIALRLRISYTTVRNHVQHALGKLGLHSIMEAVAFYLLTADRSPEMPQPAHNLLSDKDSEN